MKKIIFIAILSAFTIISCNNSSGGSHTHEDGTVRTDCGHDHDNEVQPEQEVFEVTQDSIDCKHDSLAGEHSHSHDHEGGGTHEH